MGTIRKVGVIGAGQMGAGIAQVAVCAGYDVRLWDANPAVTAPAVEKIKASVAKLIAKGALPAGATELLARLSVGTSVTDLADSDVVIEAIVENFEIKAATFKDIDAVLPKESLILSNTSSISITRMAATTSRPDRFMGVHFMNPVPIMNLLELIRGLQTSDSTYETVLDFSKKLGKTPVLAIDTPGFIVNRILCPMVNEAIFLVQEGVKPEDIDNAMKLGTNQPMGPITLADFVGLDTLLYIMQVLHRELGEDKYRPCPLLTKYVEAGWYGKKSGRGFYNYSNDPRP